VNGALVRLRACALLLAALAAPAMAPAKPPVDLARVEVAFTPGDDVAGLIARRITLGRESVQVQAYLFTDRTIARALLAALRRGVAVEVIGDAAQHESGGLPWLEPLQRAGARVYLESGHAASHNKIVIVDARTDRAAVITGSYNFTQAAQSKNAENVVVLSGNRRITDRFADNFEYHRSQSTPWP